MKRLTYGQLKKKCICFLVITILLSTFGIPGVPGMEVTEVKAAAVNYIPAADATVRGGTFVNTNYGSAGTLEVKNDTNETYSRKSFLRFDFSDFLDNDVQQAKIKIHIIAKGIDASRTVGIYGLSDADEDWEEGSVTWNNAPTSATLLQQINVASTDSVVEFDVTDFIKNQMTDRTAAFMLAVDSAASSESHVNFYSKESNMKPELIMTAQNYSTFTSLRLVLTNRNINVSGATEYRVVATTDKGKKVDVTDNASVSTVQTDKIKVDTEKKKITGLSAGVAQVSAVLGGLRQSSVLNINNFDETPIRVAGQVVVNEDFEGATPSFVPSNDAAIAVVEEESGNHALMIDGIGGIKRTLDIEGDYGNSDADSEYMLEADVKQLNSNAGSNGGISFHLRNSGDNKDYVFRYMDTLKYNAATHKYDAAQPAYRDRIGISRNNANALNEWYYGAFSSTEAGILNKTNRSFNDTYVKMSAMISNRLISQYPYDGSPSSMFDNLVFSINAPDGVKRVSTTTLIGENDNLSGVDFVSSGRYLTTLTKGKAYLQTENTKAYFDKLKITKLHMARGIQLFIKDAIVSPGQTTGFEVRAYTSAYSYTVIPNDKVTFSSLPASLGFDQEAGTMTPTVAGEYEITVTAADVMNPYKVKNYTAKLTVNNEDIFESFGEPGLRTVSQPEWLSVPGTDLVIDNDTGSQVYRLSNGVSRLMGDEDWTNYEIEGKIKIVTPMIDLKDYNTAFEVLMRRKAIQNEYLGEGGFPFVYRILHDNDDNYMRIGTSPGPKVNVVDDNWHTFSAKAISNQYIFSIDNVVQYYASGTDMSGGFAFRAENCVVYIDDIRIRKLEGGSLAEGEPSSITADKSNVEVNIYDTVDLAELTAIKAHYGAGKTKYITKDPALTFSINSGADKAELFGGDTFRFKPNAAAGDIVTIQAAYHNLPLDLALTITGAAPAIPELEYVKGGTAMRQENLLYKLRSAYEKSDRPPYAKHFMYLTEIFGKMMLNPEEENYDDAVNWMIDEVIWDEGRPNGRANGAADFYFAQMLILYNMLDGRVNVSDAVWQRMTHLLQEIDYSNPTEFMSENHRLIYFASGYLVSELWPDAMMWNGKTGLENRTMFTGYLRDWMNSRLKTGMGEFDSISYYGIDIGGLSMLYTFSKDETVKNMAFDMLDYLMADMAVDSLDANMGGAHGRTYVGSPKTMLYGHSNYGVDFLFDTAIVDVDEDYAEVNVQAGLLPISTYRPSDVLYALARDRNKRLTNKEKKAVYTIPDIPTRNKTETLKKYTHVTPEYTLGSIVQQEVAPFTSQDFQGFQDIPWSLTFGKSMDAVIFDSHPGLNETDTASPHAYWNGDYKSMTYKYFQEENVMLGMHKITNYAQFSHFWIPRKHLDEVVENKGWVFVRKNNVYAAVKMLKDGVVNDIAQYSWTKSGRWADIEAKINSQNTAFILEVADPEEFSGTFEDFITAILANEVAHPITYVINNGYYVQYQGLNGKLIKLDYNSDVREIDGLPVDFNAYKSHDAVSTINGENYMSSEWDSGEIVISHGSLSRTIRTFEVEADTNAPVTTALVMSGEPDGANDWYVSAVTVTLSATDHLSGVAKTEYRLDGSDVWEEYTDVLTINSDGEHTIYYRSTDKEGNVEEEKSIRVKRDTVAPVITVTGVTYDETYPNSEDMTPLIEVVDEVSGVDTETVTLDSNAVQPGPTISLYTLPLGVHNYVVRVSDRAGNESIQSLTFKTSTSIDTLKELVTRFANDGQISDTEISSLLLEKLEQEDLESFIDEVREHSEELISKGAATYLLRDAQHLIDPGSVQVPNTPTELRQTGSTVNTISLAWEGVEGATIYRLYRSEQPDTGFSNVTGVAYGALTHTDSGLGSGRLYYYKVTAVNEVGESVQSATLSASTQSKPVEPSSSPTPTPKPTTNTTPTPKPTTNTTPTPKPTTNITPTPKPTTNTTPTPTSNPGTIPKPTPHHGTEGQTDSGNVKTVAVSDLKETDEGFVELTLSGQQTSLSLPTSLLGSIEAGNVQIVSSDGLRIIVPVAVLKSLAATNDSVQDNQIIVKLEPVHGKAEGSANLAGEVYGIELILRTYGKDTRLSSFDEPVNVVFPIDPDTADKQLLGVYYYNEALSEWEYVGGTEFDDHVSVGLSHFSRYALMTYDKTYTDVPSTHWAYSALKILAAKHIVKGVSEDRFAPNGTTSRAEFTALLVRALGLKTANASAVPFDDVSGSAWYAEEIAVAYEADLVHGVSERSYAPDALITREQMAILIIRAYELAQGQTYSGNGSLKHYEDAESVSGWARDGVGKAIGLGLMQGKSSDRFEPGSNAIRSETAQVIYNLLQKLNSSAQ
ncbi:S-layer homology domain-containing protein [Paenibacillus sp. PL91]|uniref:CBM96 family carbohydrate-binding protein n=1 Tax=Paenibacillus sp. PL91 TaxID=2729538 RepID=UPI00145D441D|nr:S-layer homology domain-containing protein [Paenibacillus sp. PL91]MBC9202195.1 S-layer homology domain-containing protein [Paenibacillus sp. PL91]